MSAAALNNCALIRAIFRKYPEKQGATECLKGMVESVMGGEMPEEVLMAEGLECDYTLDLLHIAMEIETGRLRWKA